jgi:tRNA nucleotidyltransferase/poly(A) polymerase
MSSHLQSRLQLELNVMLGYGSARRSVELLWRTGLLEIMLPLQAEYLTAQNFSRSGKAERPELLFVSCLHMR